LVTDIRSRAGLVSFAIVFLPQEYSPAHKRSGTLYHFGLRQLFQLLPRGLVDVFFSRGFGHARLIHFLFDASEYRLVGFLLRLVFMHTCTLSRVQRDYRSIWNTQAVSELFLYQVVVGGRRDVAKMDGIKASLSHDGANRRLLGTAPMEHGSTSVQEQCGVPDPHDSHRNSTLRESQL